MSISCSVCQPNKSGNKSWVTLKLTTARRLLKSVGIAAADHVHLCVITMAANFGSRTRRIEAPVCLKSHTQYAFLVCDELFRFIINKLVHYFLFQNREKNDIRGTSNGKLFGKCSGVVNFPKRKLSNSTYIFNAVFEPHSSGGPNPK